MFEVRSWTSAMKERNFLTALVAALQLWTTISIIFTIPFLNSPSYEQDNNGPNWLTDHSGNFRVLASCLITWTMFFPLFSGILFTIKLFLWEYWSKPEISFSIYIICIGTHLLFSSFNREISSPHRYLTVLTTYNLLNVTNNCVAHNAINENRSFCFVLYHWCHLNFFFQEFQKFNWDWSKGDSVSLFTFAAVRVMTLEPSVMAHW